MLDNSIMAYTTDIYKYLEYMQDVNIKSCLDIKKDDLISYLSYLDKNKNTEFLIHFFLMN